MISFAFAQTTTNQNSFFAGSSIREIINNVGSFLSSRLMPIIVTIAVIVFMWNIGQFILNMDNEKQREQFRNYSVNAILALFILLSLWGIIGIATGTFFDKKPLIPQFPTSGN